MDVPVRRLDDALFSPPLRFETVLGLVFARLELSKLCLPSGDNDRNSGSTPENPTEASDSNATMIQQGNL
jgi:hypothetical protein